MITVNCHSKSQAIGAILNKIEKDQAKGKYSGPIPTKKTVERTYSEIFEYHPQIAEYANCEKGKELQWWDSNIIDRALINLTKKDIVGLPIHDSLIVQKKHENTTEEIMKAAYFKETGFKTFVS